jgi:hypothetical protein
VPSPTDRLCTSKEFVKGLKAFAARLQARIDAAGARSAGREAALAAAKQAWLSAEGRHAMLQQAVEEQELDLSDGLKRAAGLRAVVRDDAARLAALRANATEELRAMEEEEAPIRDQLLDPLAVMMIII